jgi:hypothetical protein
MASRRTFRKYTTWTPQEWARIETEARAHGIPPLRYVRESALAYVPKPRLKRKDVVLRLGAVLASIRELQCVSAPELAHLDSRLEATARRIEEAICCPSNVKHDEFRESHVELPLLVGNIDELDRTTLETEVLRLIQVIDDAVSEVRQ